MSGWLPLSKKSAERRCLSRLLFFVSMDAAATVMAPLTSPVGETVPFPLTSRKTPFTGARPHRLLLFSRMLDLRGSRIHAPARAASFSRACSAGPVICPDGACIIVSLSHRTDLGRLFGGLGGHQTLGAGEVGAAHSDRCDVRSPVAARGPGSRPALPSGNGPGRCRRWC